MKRSLPLLTLATALAAAPLMAQDAPPVPAPPAAPAPPPPAGAPGLLPAPATPAAEVPDGFKTEKERQSYALGLSFANNLKQEEQIRGTPLPNPDEFMKGLQDVLGGGRSLDYVIGAYFASQIKRAELELDQDALIAAVRETLTGAPQKLNAVQAQAVMKRLNDNLAERKEMKRRDEAAKALVVANQFMEQNSKGEGIKQTPSGLQYVIEKPGEGKTPVESDLVSLNFKCWQTDGSVAEKSPDTTPSRKVMRVLPKGLQEGLAMLKTGGKAKFWVPPALGYGEGGRTGQVKPNAVLVYEVELVASEPLPKQPVEGTQVPRPPVTAVTPPITVEIPPKPGEPATPAPAAPAPAASPKPPVPPVQPDQPQNK